jgi:HSP20 family molecular chaperone IbpA
MVPLPEGVDFKEVKATFRNGVLEISLPSRAFYFRRIRE